MLVLKLVTKHAEKHDQSDALDQLFHQENNIGVMGAEIIKRLKMSGTKRHHVFTEH